MRAAVSVVCLFPMVSGICLHCMIMTCPCLTYFLFVISDKIVYFFIQQSILVYLTLIWKRLITFERLIKKGNITFIPKESGQHPVIG